MKNKTLDLYIYLARRDKTGIRLIAKLKGSELLPTRISVEDLAKFQLPSTWYNYISQSIYDSRMLWEPFIQSTESFESFRIGLKKRGYSNIPVSPQPEFTTSTIQTQTINTNYLPKSSTMIRKN